MLKVNTGGCLKEKKKKIPWRKKAFITQGPEAIK